MIRKLLVTAVAGTVWLASVDTAAAQKLEYDCDAPAEHSSRIETVQPGPGHAVTGSLTVETMYAGERNLPSAQIVLAAPDDSWSARLVFIGRPKLDTGHVRAELRILGRAAPETIELGVLPLGKPAAFALTIASGGRGSVQLAGTARSFRIDVRGPAKAMAVCSSGDFQFAELDLGR